MTRNVTMIAPGATLTEAARMMDDHDVGALPVCENDRLVGIVTDRDIVIRCISSGLNPNITAVRDAMTSPVNWCFEDVDLQRAARTMEENQIRRLCVVNADKRLVGIVSLGDIAVKGHNEHQAFEVLERVSEPLKRAA